LWYNPPNPSVDQSEKLEYYLKNLDDQAEERGERDCCGKQGSFLFFAWEIPSSVRFRRSDIPFTSSPRGNPRSGPISDRQAVVVDYITLGEVFRCLIC